MISDRKLQHLEICKNYDVEHHITTGFEDINLVHRSLPEVDFEEIDTSIELLGKKLDSPLIISAITGGHTESKRINENLAIATENTNIAMGVGSQRAGISNPELKDTFTIVRESAPHAVIIGNIGAPQVEYAPKAIEMLETDMLAIHLNPLQEIIQPEGDINAKGYVEHIKEICDSTNIPIIAKETGAGISMDDARILEKIGVDAIDIQGVGGTSWAAVETYRADNPHLGNLFWDWGITTAVSTIEVLESTNLPVISSGGIRNGLEAAKAIALGADCVGMALPFLKHAYMGHTYIEEKINQFTRELKTAMFLVGASNIDELKEKKLIITGKTREILNELEIDTKKYTRRI
ncbi:type 2 isopentenyl-diphosphate Delta-isomerase [Methanosphaera sp. WGK6]|uniref:type 2 isopentenyl-diphosphate Delta-isomerase n=1 Tax=Methanosphaera sp. WGK6 TaxID=1561964 RepID=UPI00084CACAD|nr:type 2 isopentenyl-diphosphate Delta-isomerase [Methanosphaera sp. WGK6]OED29742.1 isopentenyl pyrophosphate isomerase [Methanosphaera sp. WGK6]